MSFEGPVMLQNESWLRITDMETLSGSMGVYKIDLNTITILEPINLERWRFGIFYVLDKYSQNPLYFVGGPKTREKGLKIVSFRTFVSCTALGSCSMIQPMLEIDSLPSNYPRNTLLSISDDIKCHFGKLIKKPKLPPVKKIPMLFFKNFIKISKTYLLIFFSYEA